MTYTGEDLTFPFMHFPTYLQLHTAPRSKTLYFTQKILFSFYSNGLFHRKV